MSISGISSSTNGYQNQFQQIERAFSSLQTDLSTGNLSTAQQAYTTLTQDLQNVRQTEGIQQTGGTSQINTDLAAVGSALQSGDLKTAQSAFATLTQDLQSAQPTQTQGTQQTYGRHHHHHHGTTSQAASTTSQSGSTTSQTAGTTSQTAGTTSQTAGTTSQTAGTTSQTAGTTSQSGSTSLSTDLAAVGSALQSGDLKTAQSAFATLMQDLGNSTTGTSGNSTFFQVSITTINISV